MPEIISISINSDQKSYIKEKNLSPSLIFQQRIDELRGLNPICTLTEMNILKEKVEALVKRLTKACEYMEQRGVLDEFLEQERRF